MSEKTLELVILVMFVLGVILIATYINYLFLEYKGKRNRNKWLNELKTLKKGDSITISHKAFDKEAIFIDRIVDNLSMVVQPMKNGILKSRIVISNDQFICKN